MPKRTQVQPPPLPLSISFLCTNSIWAFLLQPVPTHNWEENFQITFFWRRSIGLDEPHSEFLRRSDPDPFPYMGRMLFNFQPNIFGFVLMKFTILCLLFLLTSITIYKDVKIYPKQKKTLKSSPSKAECPECQKDKCFVSWRQFVATALWPDGRMAKTVWLTAEWRRQNDALPWLLSSFKTTCVLRAVPPDIPILRGGLDYRAQTIL